MSHAVFRRSLHAAAHTPQAWAAQRSAGGAVAAGTGMIIMCCSALVWAMPEKAEDVYERFRGCRRPGTNRLIGGGWPLQVRCHPHSPGTACVLVHVLACCLAVEDSRTGLLQAAAAAC